MNVSWSLADGTILHIDSGTNSSTFTKVLPGGKIYYLALEVEDGRGGVARRSIFFVVNPDPRIHQEITWSGMGQVCLIGLAAMVLIILVSWWASRASRDRRLPPPPSGTPPRKDR
jgi:hypothetical protein